MLTRTPNDIGCLELEDRIGRSDQAVIPMRLSLHGLVASDKCGRKFSGMGKSRLLGFGLQTRRKRVTGSNFIDRHWDAIKSNLLAATGLVALLHRHKRKGLPPWRRSRIMRARRRNRRDFMTYNAKQGYRDFPRYMAKRKRMFHIQ